MNLARLLARQDGLVTRRQALQAGLTSAAVEHRLARGRWQTVAPGLYAAISGELTSHQRLISGLLYGGPSSLLGGATAASVHGLHQLTRTRSVHLLLPHRLHRSGHSFIRVRRASSMPAPVYFDELRTVPVARAVVDACRELHGIHQVRALVAEAVQRRMTSVAALSAQVAAGGSAGSASIRLALGEVAAGAASVAEIGAHELLTGSALPPAEWNRDLFTMDGCWLARPDVWWRRAGVVLEIDSQEWHLLPEHWAATMERHARMTSYGLLVVHLTPRRIRTEPTEILAILARTIAEGERRPTPPVTDLAPAGRRRVT